MCRFNYVVSLILFVHVFHTVSEGTLEQRVLGGTKLRYRLYKYLVELQTKLRNKHQATKCSGSIVHASWIITAAHCVESPNIFSIKINHYTSEKQVRSIATIDMEKVLMHPRYNPKSSLMQNKAVDLALLKTKLKIKFNKNVRLVKMSAKIPAVGDKVAIAAYGEVERGKLGHQEGSLLVKKCDIGVPKVICTESLVRAGDGDSGGALVAAGRLVGVVSASCRHAQNHAKCVTLYTSIGANIKWIRRVISK